MAKTQKRRISDVEFSLDKDLNITWANRSFSMLFNITNNDISLSDFLDAADADILKPETAITIPSSILKSEKIELSVFSA